MTTNIQWTDETKACANCNATKPRDAFARDGSRPDGLTYWCLANAGFHKKHPPYARLRHAHGGDIAEFAEDLQVRQFPEDGAEYVTSRNGIRRAE